jgi:hypothetical protein
LSLTVIPETIAIAVIQSLKENLHWLLPVALPICLFAVSVWFKFLFGQRNFHFLGGDTAFTGFAVVSGTALRQIYYSKLTEPGEIVISILMCGAALLVAIVCWATGRRRRLPRSIVAMCIGMGSFYLFAFWSWRIIELSNK